MKSNILTKVFLLLSAFTLTDNVLIAYFEANGNSGMTDMLGAPLLSVVTICSLFYIVFDRKIWRPSILTVIVILFLAWFQKNHDVYNTSDEYTTSFIIHGIGGFFMGLAIKDYELYIKYLGIISSVYLIILITEPVNHAILQGGAMLTGYIMTTLIVYLVLSYYTVFRKNKLFLYQGILMSFLVFFLTSRGCGITLAMLWLFFYLREKIQEGKPIRKTIIIIGLVVIVFILLLPYAASYFLSTNADVSDGSLANKYASGNAGDSNGRSDIWLLGIVAISQYWHTGMGFGADRIVSGDSFIHDIFLELIIDFGIPITIFIVYFYWRPIIKLFKYNRYSIPAAFVAALAIRSWGQFLFSNSYLMNMMILMFLFGVSIRLDTYIPKKSKFKKNTNNCN